MKQWCSRVGTIHHGAQRQGVAVCLYHLLCCLLICSCNKRTGDISATRGDEADSTLLVTRYGSFDPLVDAAPDFAQRMQNAAPIAQTVAAVDTRVAKIVQCLGRIEPSWRTRIQDLGVKITGYVPNNALLVLVRVDSDESQRLETLPFVRAVLDEPRMLKLDPRLVSTAAQARMLASANDVLTVNVEMRDASARETLEPFIIGAGGVIQTNHRNGQWPAPRVLRVSLGAPLLAQLAARSEVTAIDQAMPDF